MTAQEIRQLRSVVVQTPYQPDMSSGVYIYTPRLLRSMSGSLTTIILECQES